MNWTDRVKAELKAKNLKQDDLILVMGVKTRGAVGHYLNKRREPSTKQLNDVADFLGLKFDWMINGKGEKHWTKKISHLDAEYSLEASEPQATSPESAKLIEIISEADRAMDDSGFHFTAEERIENYFAALDFAGRKHFSKELVNQYLVEMMRSSKA